MLAEATTTELTQALNPQGVETMFQKINSFYGNRVN
jgi:hypothetical protein